MCWVHFKYEQLATFCYYCGRIGYSDRMSQIRREDPRKNELREGQFGEWLKGENRRSGSKAGEGWEVARLKGLATKQAQEGHKEGTVTWRKVTTEPPVRVEGGDRELRDKKAEEGDHGRIGEML